MQSLIEQLGFERTVKVTAARTKLPVDQLSVIEDVEEFGIDEIHFSTDERNSYPAVFIKRVESFDPVSLKNIKEIHRKIWNYKKILFLYVYNDTEIRIYNCAEKPVPEADDNDYSKLLKKYEMGRALASDREKLEILGRVFSSAAIDTGIIWTLDEAAEMRRKINLQRRVDRYLVESLIKTADRLNSDGLESGVIHSIMMRSLFLLYLEDRGATDPKFYAKINKEAKSYFDILDSVDDAFALYEKLEEHFNGNVFTLDAGERKAVKREHLKLIKQCFINGYDGTDQYNLFPDWRLFNFKIIQIELLSEIYENFLTKFEKKLTGTFYTPPSLVELILNEKLPVNKNEKNCNVKILDPACGSGIFLVESFKRLVKRHENRHKTSLTDFNTLKKILTDNIYGIELNPQSVKVAAFSLYLALLDNLNPKTLWQNRKLPYLINDPADLTIKVQGKNLFRRDAIVENSEIESIEFDLVVGNPPFGTDSLLTSIRDYCENQNFAKEMVLPFMHKAVKFSPEGEIVLIFNTKVLTNTGTTYRNFRWWLFNDCYVEKIYNFSILRNAPKNFGGQLFGSATGPISIAFYRKDAPGKASDRIIYYAPKTFVKSNVLEGVVIDSLDVKYLPRTECQKPDSKIWKIAMWGGAGDIELINKLQSKKFLSVQQFTEKNNIKSAVGFQLLTQDKDEPRSSESLPEMKYLDAEHISRYYTSKDSLLNVKASIKTKKAVSYYKALYKVNNINEIDKLSDFRRLGDKEAYESPHIFIKKGFENNRICASYLDAPCSFRDGVNGFYSSNKDILKALMAYFNSRFSTYFLFMTSSSYGIEREQIMKREYLTIPVGMGSDEIYKITPTVDGIIDELKKSFGHDKQKIDKHINDIESVINESLSLTDRDAIIIKDIIEYNLDLFHKKQRSKALKPAINIKPYTDMLCDELNDFLDEQNLFAGATLYPVKNKYTPLLMIKITFSDKPQKLVTSAESLDAELRTLNKYLWEEKAGSLYFRKKLNYYDGDDIYIIRPNQQRFWTRTMAMEDASELILEILTND